MQKGENGAEQSTTASSEMTMSQGLGDFFMELRRVERENEEGAHRENGEREREREGEQGRIIKIIIK